MNTKQSLQELGLTKNDACVYQALLELGLTQAGAIIKATKLHRMLVYNALESLTNQGLATAVHKNKVRLFQPTDPGVLLERTKQTHELAKALIPDLRRLLQNKNNVVDIRTLVGHEGFITNLEQVIDSAAGQKNKTIHIIGGAKDTDFYRTVGSWYATYTELLEIHTIKKQLLAPASYSSSFRKKFAVERNSELRTMPQGLTSPTYTRITQEMVTIEMYEPQIIIIQIRNRIIAQGYLDSFELLWKTQAHTK